MVDDDLRPRIPTPGKAAWAYQMTPRDAWDYDGINENVLVDLNVNGQMRKVLVHFDRNGFAYMLDRTRPANCCRGRALRARELGQGRRPQDRPADRGPSKRTTATDTKDICPSAMGGKNQQPVSFSPRTNLSTSAPTTCA